MATWRALLLLYVPGVTSEKGNDLLSNLPSARTTLESYLRCIDPTTYTLPQCRAHTRHGPPTTSP